MKKIWDTIRWFTNKAGDAALDARAGQSAFFMVISFFPALLLVVSLCRAMHIAESELLGDLVRLLHRQQEVYPAQFLYALMNLIGSHDRARVLNVLCGKEGRELPRRLQRNL